MSKHHIEQVVAAIPVQTQEALAKRLAANPYMTSRQVTLLCPLTTDEARLLLDELGLDEESVNALHDLENEKGQAVARWAVHACMSDIAESADSPVCRLAELIATALPRPQAADDASADGRARQDEPLPEIERQMSTEAVEHAVYDLLSALGEDVTREGLRDTPARSARFFAEFFGRSVDRFTTFANDGTYNETVVVRDIEFFSLCEHHLLPFRGKAHLAYKPGKRIAGLSKLTRVVDLFAGRLQLQEALTTQIATFLEKKLEPAGVAVVIEAEHLCMSMRGVSRPHHSTVTSTVRGCFTSGGQRAEVLALLRPSNGR